MKKNILLYALSAGLIAACADDNEVTQQQPDAAGDVAANVPDFVPYHMDDADAAPEGRSVINWGVKDGKPDVTFSWSANDKLAIFSSRGENTSMMKFEIEGEPDGKKATFSSKDFKLTEDISYYAFSPYERVSPNDQKEKIIVKYENQHQKSNKNTEHLGDYDFLAANSVVSGGGANFAFQRLGAILRVRVGFSDFTDGKKVRINKFELVRKDNLEIPYERIVDLTASKDLDAAYKPTIVAGHEPALGGTERQSFVLNLGEFEPTTGKYLGIEVEKYTSAQNNLLVMYMMMPGTDELKGQPLYGVMTDTDGNEYFTSMTGFDLVGGTYNSYTDIHPTESGQLAIKLRVAKEWQTGHTTQQSRGASTGDPGVTDALEKPDHIYVYVCKDGTFIQSYETTTSDANWTDSKDGKEWIYSESITLNTGADPVSTDIHTYIVVSKGNITPTASASLTAGSTLEDVVKTMTFDATSQTEDVLKNVYSTDYKVLKGQPTSFVATVYHTAAKLDVQWNSTAALSGNVSINNLPTATLNLFGGTTAGTTTTWSPSAALTTGTKWNGRQVFYVPNLASGTYNITTGTGTGKTKDVTFTAPASTDKGAPWLKANITIE